MAVTWFILASLWTHAVFVRAQSGFISIDCGLGGNDSYKEEKYTQITYLSDAGFIDTGVDRNLTEAFVPSYLMEYYKNVRSFPHGSRNCYTLGPVNRGDKYFIRASFLYGNYDNEGSLPQFNLYIGVNLWSTITINNASTAFYKELITVATMKNIFVCLVNTGKGTPFISALELRPLASSLYGASETMSLMLNLRRDVGSPLDNFVRYPTDPSDLEWDPKGGPPWSTFSTIHNVRNQNGFIEPPSQIMMTAVKPVNDSNPLYYGWNAANRTLQFQVYMHFAELIDTSLTREFTICCENWCYSEPFSPQYLVTDTIQTTLTGKRYYQCTFTKTATSNLPPMLNAVETYIILQLPITPTRSQDVEAMIDIKATYKVKRNWMGDPCLPETYLWEGLTCDYPGSGPPTIKSLDLSSTGLNGVIAASLANLTFIQSLDLSGNNLSGHIPDFLGELQSLALLNLNGNQLNGTVPSNLLERSNKGFLKLSVGGNPNLDTGDKQSNGATNKLKVIAAVVTASVASTAILLIILWTLKRRKHGYNSLPSANRPFKHDEVIKITNNFERVVGRGGSGTVYHGQMSDGTRVAVKKLSPESVKSHSQPSQCSNQFQNEAQVLMRVHHRNVVSLIGYCQEGDNMALIYQFMAQGNLERHLRGAENQSLSWDQRLCIALDVAQGLEYLHNFSEPAIIHRDVKTTNILLNEKLEAKIGDFGFSKILLKDNELTDVTPSAVKGTPGYLDPEYYTSNNLTVKSDVYSFGVVLLQLITGKPAVYRDSDHEMKTLVDWAGPIITRGDIQGVVDPRLEGHYDLNSLWKAAEVALACTSVRSAERPTMSSVVSELKESMETEIASERNRFLKRDPVEMGSIVYHYPLPR